MGERECRVLEAVRKLESADVQVVSCSSLYESEPADGAGGENFINAVVQVRSLLCPGDLLKRLKTIEKAMGRTGGHNQSREIDIDIVSFGETIVETADLTIPHPRFGGRVFVLVPLAEVAPGFRCPLTGVSVRDLIGALGYNHAITRVSGRSVVAATSL